MLDAVIIGGGVVGCAAARFLSRFQGDFLLLERGNDLCCGTSKANSAIIHAGFDAKAGSLMAKYNVLGSRMMEALSKELDFPYRRNGSLVLCLAEGDLPKLRALYENGLKNGVEGLEILDRQALLEKEPNIGDEAVAALWAPTGAIVCPFGLTYALGENAARNGVDFRFNQTVTRVSPQAGHYLVETAQGERYETRAVVNAAGLYADVFHNQVSAHKIHITPRRGEYMLLDKSAGNHVRSTVFRLPGAKGKGVLVTPTVHGNLLVGPTAEDLGDKECTATSREGLRDLAQKAEQSVKNLPLRQVITSFAGLRAHEDGHEFILGEPQDAPLFFDCAGIESPGLSASPAIGKFISEEAARALGLGEKPDFVPTRKAPLDPRALSKEERAALIAREPAYGQIICRCEEISEGEILDAIRRPLGARDMDGVKRRTRAGMGRCQGGFCTPRVMELLSETLGLDQREITKNGGASRMITAKAKDED